MTIDASTIDTLRKLAMDSRDTEGAEWYCEDTFMFVMPAADRKYFAELTPSRLLELLRLAEIGQTPMNQRESPHCASCSCGVTK